MKKDASVRDVSPDHDSCPLRGSVFGGIPGGGGLTPYKEYAVGASQTAEALHCILGSLRRSIGSDWFPRGDIGHIDEEVDKIEKYVEEYARPIYVEQLNNYPDNEYVQKLVEAIEGGEYDTLRRKAQKYMGQLGDDLPDHAYELATSVYRALVELVDAMKASLSSKPGIIVEPGDNAFRDASLRKAIKDVARHAETFKRVEKQVDERRARKANVNLHAKVAHRYLYGGTVKPPPELLSDVRAFLRSKWAGHVLAVVRDNLQRLREKQESYDDMVDRVEHEVDRFRDMEVEIPVEDIPNQLRNREPRHFVLRPDENKGVLVGTNIEGFWYQYTRDGDPYGRTYDGYGPYEIKRKIFDAFDDALRELMTKARDASEAAEDEDFSYVELNRIQEAARTYAGEVKRYKSTARKTIPVRLKGWSYIENPSEAQMRLDDMDFDAIQVILYFDQHVTRHGQWNFADRELEVDAPTEPHTIDQFEEGIARLERTARHETQHVAQYLLRELKGLDELGGMPPDEVRDPNFDEFGRSDSGRYWRDHALQDIEFQTRLEDNIDDFSDLAQRISPSLRRSAMRVWVGDPDEGDKQVASQINDRLDLEVGERVETTELFRRLKSLEEDKWREAASEFVSEVQQRIDVP